MASTEHWKQVYQDKPADSASWYQQHASTSLHFISRTGVPLDGPIIDVGGGASTLVDDLLDKGYSAITVLDLAAAALQVAQARLGLRASQVVWLAGDITSIRLLPAAYDIWHDRAVFHFLVEAADRAAYKKTLLSSVKSGGHVILATFAEDGPLKCSGLPVKRYGVAELQQELGGQFTFLHSQPEQHVTPSGAIQNFNYCHFKKSAF